MSLKEFVSKFNDSAGRYAYTIDPLKTFTCSIVFSSGDAGSSGNRTIVGRFLENTLNTVTGGLWGKASAGNVQGPYENIADIIKDSKIDGGMGAAFDCTYFIQSANLPNIAIPDAEKINTMVGSISTHKMMLEPASQTFSMAVVNTKASLIERIFYPWMREVSYPFWSYPDYPYTTAEIIFDMTPHNVIKYHFLGCRPTAIDLIGPTQSLDQNLTRNVTMTFDFAFIELADTKSGETAMDALKKLGGSIISKAMSTVGI